MPNKQIDGHYHKNEENNMVKNNNHNEEFL